MKPVFLLMAFATLVATQAWASRWECHGATDTYYVMFIFDPICESQARITLQVEHIESKRTREARFEGPAPVDGHVSFRARNVGNFALISAKFKKDGYGSGKFRLKGRATQEMDLACVETL